MTVVGYRRADFRGSDGHMVEGYRVYLANMGVDVESLLGRNLHVYYTKSGKVSDIVLDA